MALVVKLNGTPIGIRNLNISFAQNERARLTGSLISSSLAGLPDIDDTLEVIEDGTALFGGTVKVPTSSGFEDTTSFVGQVSATDFAEIADRDVYTGTIPAGTKLKAGVTLLLPYLPGMTIDPLWTSDGPDLPEMSFDTVPVETVLAKFTEATRWLRSVGPTKAIRFFELGDVSLAAPWSVSNNNVVGTPTLKRNRLDYANRVIVKFSEAARKAYAFLRTTGNFSDGEEVTVGNQTYTFVSSLSPEAGRVLVGATAQDSLSNLVNAIVRGAGNGVVYSDATVVNGSVGAAPWDSVMANVFALAPGASGNSIGCTTTALAATWVTEGNVPTDHLTFGSDVSLTNSAEANDLTEQALYGRYTRSYEAAHLFSYADALAAAADILAAAKILQYTFSYRTNGTGLLPGMTQPITWTKLGFSAECFIASVVLRHIEGTITEREVVAVTGGVYKGNQWRDLYRQWSGKMSGSTPITFVSSGGSGSVVSNVPFTLGGSRSQPLELAVADFASVPEWKRFVAPVSGTIRVTADLWAMNSGVSVYARIWCITDGTAAGSEVLLGPYTSPATISWDVPVSIDKEYCLQIKASGNNQPVYGDGTARYL